MTGRRTGVNFNKNHRRKDSAQEAYAAAVLLVPCPSCGVPATKWCKNAHGRVRPEPHDARVALAKLGT